VATNGRKSYSVYGRYLMNKVVEHEPSDHEKRYIQAFSRNTVVEAYTNWNQFSDIEQKCFDMFLNVNPSVLDLGCGVGRVPRMLGNKIGRYLGLDLHRE